MKFFAAVAALEAWYTTHQPEIAAAYQAVAALKPAAVEAAGLLKAVTAKPAG